MLLKLFYSSSNDNFTVWEGFTVSNPKSQIPMVNLTYENRFVFSIHYELLQSLKKFIFTS